MTTARAPGVILMTCEYPPFPGGIGTYSGGVVKALRDSGYPVTVIAPRYPELPDQGSETDTHRILDHHKIGPGALLPLLRVLRQAPADSSLLAADIRSVLVLHALRFLHRRPYRVMLHGSEASKFNANSPLGYIVRRAYLGSDFVLYNSAATRDIFHARIGRPQREAITYLGVDRRWFEPPAGGFEHSELAALPEASVIVCSVGRIEPRKGQLETIRVLARARETYGLPDPVYVVAGRPEGEAYQAEVREEARRLSVRLIFGGRLSEADLRLLYRRSVCHSLFARELAGRIEGFGLVLLEAAAQACPSVATRVGGIPEVLGDTGVLVPPEDIDAAARAIAAYAEDRELRTRDGLAAYERAKEFSWLSCADKTFPELRLGEASAGNGGSVQLALAAAQ